MLNEIATLGDLPRQELATRWSEIYAKPAPKGARRVLLERAIAWHLQAKVEGQLAKEVLRRLDRLIARAERRATAGADCMAADELRGDDC